MNILLRPEYVSMAAFAKRPGRFGEIPVVVCSMGIMTIDTDEFAGIEKPVPNSGARELFLHFVVAPEAQRDAGKSGSGFGTVRLPMATCAFSGGKWTVGILRNQLRPVRGMGVMTTGAYRVLECQAAVRIDQRLRSGGMAREAQLGLCRFELMRLLAPRSEVAMIQMTLRAAAFHSRMNHLLAQSRLNRLVAGQTGRVRGTRECRRRLSRLGR